MSEDLKFYILAIRNILMAAAYLFLIFGSIYGIFLYEISIPYNLIPLEYLVFTGGPRILLCLTGFTFAASLPGLPIILGVLRALGNGQESESESKIRTRKLYILVTGFFILLFVIAILWQVANNSK